FKGCGGVSGRREVFDFPALSRLNAKSLWNHCSFATIIEPGGNREALPRYSYAYRLFHSREVRRSWWWSWRIHRDFEVNAQRFVRSLLELFELGAQHGKQFVLRSSRELRTFQLMDQFFCFVSSCKQRCSTCRRILQGICFARIIDMLLQRFQRGSQERDLGFFSAQPGSQSHNGSINTVSKF